MFFPFSIGTTLDGRPVLGHMLVAGQHPGDLVEIDAVLVLQDAARPDAGGDRVAAVDADPPAFQVLGRLDAGLRVDQDGAVMEGAHQEDRQRREPLPMRPGADVGGDRHLADVELEPAHHAPEGVDERIHLHEIEFEAARPHGAVLEGLVVALRAGHGSELGSGHRRFAPVTAFSR